MSTRLAGRRGVLWVVGVVSVLAACGQGDDEPLVPPDPTDTSTTAATTTGSTGAPSTATTAPPGTDPPGTDPPGTSTVESSSAAAETCARRRIDTLATFEDARLGEISGIAASRRHPGVVWVVNDGSVDELVAVGLDGAVVGVHPLHFTARHPFDDVEDLALVGGDDADELVLADIGDNGADRETIRIVRVREPDPAHEGPLDVEIVTFTYPDRPHNAEALLVDEAFERVVVVTKEQARDDDERLDEFGATLPSMVFEGPLRPTAEGRPIELTLVGSLDTVSLEERTTAPLPHPVSVLGFGGMPTGGDVSPDGSLIALRTYEAVWVWPREPGETVAASLLRLDDAVPCQVATAVERQGEAVTFVGERLLTISEGRSPAIHLLAG